MTKSRIDALGKADLSNEEIKTYYKDAAMDSLLYWTNCTITHAGANATMTLLTELLATCITNLIPPDQVDRAQDVIFDLLSESFDTVRGNVTQPAGNPDLN